MRVVVAGAGVGGLAAGIRLAAAGHAVTVLEQAPAPGGKAGRLEIDGYRFDTGPSLLTLPDILAGLFADTGEPLADELELLPVEPVTRYRFADGSQVQLSADLPRAVAALEAWSPGAGTDWAAFLDLCAGMWSAALPVLTGPAPWPPHRPRPGDPAPDPRSLLRVRPWETLSGLARRRIRDSRLRMVVERFATYAGADPRRAPAALALAGYVEHAFGAWHVRGGLYEIVRALERRLHAVGATLCAGAEVVDIELAGGRVTGVRTAAGEHIACDVVIWNGDAAALPAALPGADRADRGVRGRRARAIRRAADGERSLSGFALMLGLSGFTPGLAHHTILFPWDYGAEFDDIFTARRPVRDPTLYVSASAITGAGEAPAGSENWFVLVNAPVHGPAGVDWIATADRYEEEVLEHLARRGLDVGDRIEVRARRTPADLERETGAWGGAIYGAAPHGRLGTLRRPANVVTAARGLFLVGGTTHPGGGLPLVLLSAKIVADQIGPA